MAQTLCSKVKQIKVVIFISESVNFIIISVLCTSFISVMGTTGPEMLWVLHELVNVKIRRINLKIYQFLYSFYLKLLGMCSLSLEKTVPYCPICGPLYPTGVPFPLRHLILLLHIYMCVCGQGVCVWFYGLILKQGTINESKHICLCRIDLIHWIWSSLQLMAHILDK